MNKAFTREQIEELRRLIFALHDQSITPEDSAKLEAWICRDAEACLFFVQQMNLYARLHWDKKKEPSFDQELPVDDMPRVRIPVLGFLADTFQSGANFFGRSFFFSLLFAIGLPAVILAILFVHVSSQQPLKPMVQNEPHNISPRVVAMTPVAQVTRTHQCVWAHDGETVLAGTFLPAGEKLCLSEGLAEVTFGDGTQVLLQGPVAFGTKTDKSVLLFSGNLVASVPKEATGFTVETPTTTVVDLGTEFGVYVEDQGRIADVQVFQGEVELSASKNKKVKPRRLKMGQAVRVERSRVKNDYIVHEITPVADRFVRSIPKTSAEPPKVKDQDKSAPAIVDDFSGGNGDLQANQFPGIPGPGWATAWKVATPKDFNVVASVEDAHPMHDGGKYLRVLVKRESGGTWVREVVARQLQSTSQIDLNKPYVITFDFRVDQLRQCQITGNGLIIYGSTNFLTKAKRGNGWAIRMSGAEADGMPANHWVLFDRNNNGKDKLINSEIPVKEGAIYSFRIEVDPQTKTWRPSIGVNGGKLRIFPILHIRFKEKVDKSVSCPVLHFDWRMRGKNEGNSQKTIGYSLDSLRITSTTPITKPDNPENTSDNSEQSALKSNATEPGSIE